MEGVCEDLDGRIAAFLESYTEYSADELTAKRYDRFRRM